MGSNSSTEFPASSTQNSLTRKAGGRKEVEKETQVHIFILIYSPRLTRFGKDLLQIIKKCFSPGNS